MPTKYCQKVVVNGVFTLITIYPLHTITNTECNEGAILRGRSNKKIRADIMNYHNYIPEIIPGNNYNKRYLGL